jgi:hypothetical protein
MCVPISKTHLAASTIPHYLNNYVERRETEKMETKRHDLAA